MAVYGVAEDLAASNVAVEGVNHSSNGTAVLGTKRDQRLDGRSFGQVASPAGAGVVGINMASTGNGPGVNGTRRSAPQQLPSSGTTNRRQAARRWELWA